VAVRAGFLAQKWVRVGQEELGIDVDRLLTPARIGAELVVLAKTARIDRGRETTINGVAVREISTWSATASVTVAKPYRIMRLASSSASAPEATPTSSGPPRRQRAVYDFELYVDKLPPEQIEKLVAQIDAKVRELADSIDSQVSFTAKPGIALAPCGNFSCTVNVTITSDFQSRSPYIKADEPVSVLVEVHWTYDGRPIGGTCVGEATVPPRGSAQVRFSPPCTVTYTTPADNKTHFIEARVEGFARAMAEVDIGKVADRLAKQSVELRMCMAGPHGLPGWSDRHGPVRYVPPRSWKPGQDLPKNPDGGFRDEYGNSWTLGRPSEAVKSAFSKEWDVQFSTQGLQAWKNNGWPVKGEGQQAHGNITPDGYDSHGTQPDRSDIPHCDN
jgi:hypothetical protein